MGLDLLILFVVLPLLVVGPVIWFVSWRFRDATPPRLTSEVLATGEPARAEVTAIKTTGGFLDPRPMVRLGLRITSLDGPVDLEVTQSIPRDVLRQLRTGDVVDVRVTSDGAAAAIVI
jgi:hypothetical protein